MSNKVEELASELRSLYKARSHSRYVTTVAVHDEETECLWVLKPCLWFEDSGQPLVRLAVPRPITVTNAKSLVARRVHWYSKPCSCAMP
jgi:hypothetical protein